MKNKFNVAQEVIDIALYEIGQYMKIARKDKGLSQQDLADKMSVTSNHISRVENGRIGFTMDFFLSWCAHLEINPLLVPRTENPYNLQELLKIIAIRNPEDN